MRKLIAENFEDILVAAGLLLVGVSAASWFLSSHGPSGFSWIAIAIGLALCSGISGHTFVERGIGVVVLGVLLFLLWGAANDRYAKKKIEPKPDTMREK